MRPIEMSISGMINPTKAVTSRLTSNSQAPALNVNMGVIDILGLLDSRRRFHEYISDFF